MPNAGLINSFEGPAGRDEEFVSHVRAAAAGLKEAEGFVSTKLHKSLDDTARFRFVNVAKWTSARHFQLAVQSDAFQAVSRKLNFAAYPSLYDVILTIESD